MSFWLIPVNLGAAAVGFFLPIQGWEWFSYGTAIINLFCAWLTAKWWWEGRNT